MKFSSMFIGLASVLAGVQSIAESFEKTGEAISKLKRVGPAIGQLPGKKRGSGRLDQLRTETHDVRTIEERVRYILQMIKKGADSPYVRKAAVLAVSQKCGERWCTPEKNHLAELQSVYEWIRNQIRYVRDTSGKDLFQHPARTLQFHGGDCDDYSIVISSLLRAIGYDHLKLRIIRTDDSKDWNHIYVMVGIPPRGAKPQRWIAMDASVDQHAGWDPVKEMKGRIAAVRDFRVP